MLGPCFSTFSYSAGIKLWLVPILPLILNMWLGGGEGWEGCGWKPLQIIGAPSSCGGCTMCPQAWEPAADGFPSWRNIYLPWIGAPSPEGVCTMCPNGWKSCQLSQAPRHRDAPWSPGWEPGSADWTLSHRDAWCMLWLGAWSAEGSPSHRNLILTGAEGVQDQDLGLPLHQRYDLMGSHTWFHSHTLSPLLPSPPAPNAMCAIV